MIGRTRKFCCSPEDLSTAAATLSRPKVRVASRLDRDGKWVHRVILREEEKENDKDKLRKLLLLQDFLDYLPSLVIPVLVPRYFANLKIDSTTI